MIINTPRILATDDERKWMALTWLTGREAKAADNKYIENFVEFLSVLNKQNKNASQSKHKYKYMAKDSYTNTTSVIKNIKKRYKCALNDTSIGNDIKSWIRSEMNNKIEKLDKVKYDETNIKRRIISPSDIGIQNCLRESDKFVFFDFEYGGKDDIHKAICDLILQPRHLLNVEDVKTLLKCVEDKENLKQRIERNVINNLLALYQIKWIFIMTRYRDMLNIDKYNQYTEKLIAELQEKI